MAWTWCAVGMLTMEERVLVTPATYVPPVESVTIEGADALRRFLAITV